MADVELEIVDLATGESLGKFPLTLCTPETFELDVGSYRFTATYLKTGETLQSDVDVVEGANPPLDFTFRPATYTLRIESTPITEIPVTIDGVEAGRTPVSTMVSEGNHTVAVPSEQERSKRVRF